MYSRVSLLNCPKTKNSQFTASTEADDQSVSLTYFKLQAGLFHACTTRTQRCRQIVAFKPHDTMWLALRLLIVSEDTMFAKITGGPPQMFRTKKSKETFKSPPPSETWKRGI